MSQYVQGTKVSVNDPQFEAALTAFVDYRGDTTIVLKNGELVTGYVYSATPQWIELFPTGSSEKMSVRREEVSEIIFSGEDTSAGKSWEEWQKKQAQKN